MIPVKDDDAEKKEEDEKEEEEEEKDGEYLYHNVFVTSSF